jgi:hypothetical protein
MLTAIECSHTTFRLLAFTSAKAKDDSASESIDSLDRWREHLAVILANRNNGDVSSVLSLGDALLRQGNRIASDIWYAFLL